MIRQSTSKKVAQDIVDNNFRNHKLYDPIKIIPDYDNCLVKYYYRLPPGTVLDKSLIPQKGSFTDSIGKKFELLLIDVEIIINSIVRTTYTYSTIPIESVESKFLLGDSSSTSFYDGERDFSEFEGNSEFMHSSSSYSRQDCIGLCIPSCKNCKTP